MNCCSRNRPLLPTPAQPSVSPRKLQAGAGPSVVLIHGIPTNAFLWRNVARRLVDAGREVITVDMLGYGASDKPANADIGIAAQAQLISRVLSQIGWAGGTIVGHDIEGASRSFWRSMTASESAISLLST